MKYKGSRQWLTKAQGNKTKEDEKNGIAEIRKAMKMKKTTTTDTEVTKVVAQTRLDTNPVSNKDNKQENKQNKTKKELRVKKD